MTEGGRRRLTVLQKDGLGLGEGDTTVLTPDSVREKELLDKIATDLSTSYYATGSRTEASRESKKEKERVVMEEPAGWFENVPMGCACWKGMKPEAPNQDSFTAVVVKDHFALYGVFDGHGPHGHVISEYARHNMVCIFLDSTERNDDPEKAFLSTFRQIQSGIEAAPIDASVSGTTCTVVYHNFNAQTLTIAHVGDSRGMLACDGSILYETEDHKPELPKERERIENSKPPGRVVHDGYYNYRIFSQKGMYPGLNMSRAFGDIIAHKEAGLSAEPHVRTIDLSKDFNATGSLLICSDGVWEFISSDEGVAMVNNVYAKKLKELGTHGDACVAAARELAQQSYSKWMADSDDEISDDITIIFVRILPNGFAKE